MASYLTTSFARRTSQKSLYDLSSHILLRFSSFSAARRTLALQHARYEPDNDRGRHCVLEEERRRLLLLR